MSKYSTFPTEIVGDTAGTAGQMNNLSVKGHVGSFHDTYGGHYNYLTPPT